MLQAHELRKSYGPLTAVVGVSFRVPAGQCVGLLGPNGAGKTTTVSMIAGLLRPDAGEVRIDGEVLTGDTHPAKRKIGFATQDISLYEELSARANLELFAALYGLTGAAARERVDDVLAFAGLSERAGSRVAGFSGGMKRRLNLAAALVHDPTVLLLDEPTAGVDPQSRNALFDNLLDLKARGKTIIYTTHYMEEAERLCDRIIIIDHGRVIADDSLAGLYRLLPAAEKLAIDIESGPVNLEALKALTPVKDAALGEGGRLTLWLVDLAAGVPRVLDELTRQGVRYSRVASEAPTLETVFLTLTGRSLRD